MVKKVFKAIAAAVLLMTVSGAGLETTALPVVYAQEESAGEQETTDKTNEGATAGQDNASNAGTNAGLQTELTDQEMARVRFRMILCVIFGVGISVAIAIWGNPNERLKSRYKRARKLQQKQEKERLAKERLEQKKKEQELQEAEEKKEQ